MRTAERQRAPTTKKKCTVYDHSQPYVGQETVDNVHQTEAMSERIKLLRNNGLKTGAAKSIMRVLLLGALDLPCEAMNLVSWDRGYGFVTTFGIYMTVMSGCWGLLLP